MKAERMPAAESVAGAPAPAEPEDIRRPLSAGGPGFLRVRLRLDEPGHLTVRAVRFVAGASVAAEPLRSGHVYEVIANGRTVAAGNLADLGVRRSYGNPQAGQHGHLDIRDPNPEFTVRIPAGELSEAEAGAAEVRLYELAEAAPLSARTVARLPAARLVASTGLGPLGHLPEEARAEVARALRGSPS